MRYYEETAREIIQVFKLNPKVILNWRFKKKIPDRYLYYNFPKNITTAAETDELKRLCDILKSGLINIPAFCRRENIALQRILKYFSGNGALYREDLIAIRNTADNIQLEVKAVADGLVQPKLSPKVLLKTRQLLNREEINWAYLFSGDNQHLTMLNNWKDEEQATLSKEAREQLSGALQRFLSLTAF
ncbi:hypothetical protein [Chitinophaga sp. Cy-1792]|uniref:hypothetical protein n=1 Tax=Chitinophaga sp. Cy-1792 TaxID=2608339 RepID=UPI0014216C25|nr:hypothetical protein [Chitinophaga sp. Cy-1792]NIG56440.1 hypothetical protein [Chitinophaga sp. Cy-1792]